MKDTAILNALDNRESIISSLKNLLSKENYIKVLLYWEQGLSQSEMAKKADVGQATVSRAKNRLEELDLLEEGEEGLTASIEVLNHPLVRESYIEVLENE